MPRQRRDWGNVERFVRGWLKGQTGREVLTETTGDLVADPPVYQIARVGGSDRSQWDKRVNIEVDSIATSRAAVWDAAGAAQSAMEFLSSNGTDEWYVDDVEEIFAPAIEPYENSTVRRTTATYALTIRPRPKQPLTP